MQLLEIFFYGDFYMQLLVVMFDMGCYKKKTPNGYIMPMEFRVIFFFLA